MTKRLPDAALETGKVQVRRAFCPGVDGIAVGQLLTEALDLQSSPSHNVGMQVLMM